jgi:uncharacterized protein YaiI (UPF0178 family)
LQPAFAGLNSLPHYERDRACIYLARWAAFIARGFNIPLAAAVIDKQAVALNPRGELYTQANVREALDMRNFMDGLRAAGVQTGGPAAFSQADRQAFANQLDRLLARLPRP